MTKGTRLVFLVVSIILTLVFLAVFASCLSALVVVTSFFVVSYLPGFWVPDMARTYVPTVKRKPS